MDISIKVKGNLRSDAGKLLLRAALDGQGVFVGPTYMIDKPIREGLLKEVLVDYARPPAGLYAIYPQSKHVPPKVRAFVDYLVETVR